MIERVNEEIRRRTKSVGIFPNTQAYVRLVTCNMLEYTEDWASGHVYIHPDHLKPLLQPIESLTLASGSQEHSA